MTHQEYLDKCQQLRSLASELERYTSEQLNAYWQTNNQLSYAQLRNYGNTEKARLALHTIGTLSAFELVYYPLEPIAE